MIYYIKTSRAARNYCCTILTHIPKYFNPPCMCARPPVAVSPYAYQSSCYFTPSTLRVLCYDLFYLLFRKSLSTRSLGLLQNTLCSLFFWSVIFGLVGTCVIAGLCYFRTNALLGLFAITPMSSNHIQIHFFMV